jgi:glycosyltransferase involved in cell wall biosynthesis
LRDVRTGLDVSSVASLVPTVTRAPDGVTIANGGSNVKLVCIFASPMPYNTPILNELARRLDLHVIYMSSKDRVTRFADLWGDEPQFDYSFFWSRALTSAAVDLRASFSIGISRRLSRLRPDAILVRSWQPLVLEPVLWSRLSGRAAIMWSESTRFSGVMRGAMSTALRRALLQSVDSFVSNGSQATVYLRELGVPEGKIVTSRLPAGSTLLAPGSAARSSAEGDMTVRFLYVGRLIPQKRPLELIETFATVRREVPDTTLTLVGGGLLESKVRDAAQRASGVRYVGFREGLELAHHYAESDVLVLPALREVWGLVVNEALAHGLFVVATDEVGSAYDLLGEQTGLMVPANDLARFGSALVETARTLDVSSDARRARADAVSDCTPERFAADIVEAADLALSRKSGRQGASRRSR